MKIYQSIARTQVLFFFFMFAMVLLFAVAVDLTANHVGFSFILTTLESLLFFSLTGLRTVSLIGVYYVFSFIFLGLIPWIHYTAGAIIWGAESFSDSEYILVNTYIFIAHAIVAGIYILKKHLKQKKEIVTYNFYSKNSDKKLIIGLATLSAIALWVVFSINDYSLTKLLFRGIADDSTVVKVDSLPIFLILNMSSRLLPFFCFLYAVTQIKEQLLLKFFIFIILIFAVFPTGVPRYMVGFVYLPVLLMFVPWLRDGRNFFAILCLSIFFVFPFLDQFRYFSSFDDLRFLPDKRFFYAGHFDAYENFARAIQYKFTTNGIQLLGVALFFIPRSIWPEKPFGSGFQMAESIGYPFGNISMTFLGEGYINFGSIGVFAFAASLALTMATFDKKYSLRLLEGKIYDYKVATYLYLCGGIFFILRGDLLSSASYLISGISVYFFVKSFAAYIRKF